MISNNSSNYKEIIKINILQNLIKTIFLLDNSMYVCCNMDSV